MVCLHHLAAETLSLCVRFEIIKGFSVSGYPDILDAESTKTSLANDVSIVQNY